MAAVESQINLLWDITPPSITNPTEDGLLNKYENFGGFQEPEGHAVTPEYLGCSLKLYRGEEYLVVKSEELGEVLGEKVSSVSMGWSVLLYYKNSRSTEVCQRDATPTISLEENIKISEDGKLSLVDYGSTSPIVMATGFMASTKDGVPTNLNR